MLFTFTQILHINNSYLMRLDKQDQEKKSYQILLKN